LQATALNVSATASTQSLARLIGASTLSLANSSFSGAFTACPDVTLCYDESNYFDVPRLWDYAAPPLQYFVALQFNVVNVVFADCAATTYGAPPQFLPFIDLIVSTGAHTTTRIEFAHRTPRLPLGHLSVDPATNYLFANVTVPSSCIVSVDS
jgi:hypothetical protein